jgi:hypothetical protein
MSSIWLMLKPETPGGGSLDPGGVFARPGSRTGLGAIGPMTHSGLEKMAQAQHYARPRHGAGGNPPPAPRRACAHAQKRPAPGPDGKFHDPTGFFPAQLSQCLMAVSRMRPRRFSHVQSCLCATLTQH